MLNATASEALIPSKLRPGDRIRFVSPASTPERTSVETAAELVRGLGFEVDFGPHVFAEHGPFAGTDAQRLSDLNAAIADPAIRAIFATRGGKGSYRICDRLDFAAMWRDPKPLLGFSDISALHMAVLRHAGVAGFHGALYGDGTGGLEPGNRDLLLSMLTGGGEAVLRTRPDEPSARIMRGGQAEGPLIGGNIDTLATLAGWGLPDLRGAILAIEATECQPGRLDRVLTLLVKGGHLDGIHGIAVGQFTNDARPDRLPGILALVGEHLFDLGVPVLGGLPFGHGRQALTMPLGTRARLDADAGQLAVSY